MLTLAFAQMILRTEHSIVFYSLMKTAYTSLSMMNNFRVFFSRKLIFKIQLKLIVMVRISLLKIIKLNLENNTLLLLFSRI